MKVKVLEPLKYDGKLYEPGSVVDIRKEALKPLLDARVVEKVKKEEAPKGKGGNKNNKKNETASSQEEAK